MSETRIGVIADTHYVPYKAAGFPLDKIKEIFDKTSLIIHAGDLTNLNMLEMLEDIAPVEAVCGNMDSFEVSMRVPKKKTVNCGGKNIGIIHGFGSPEEFPQKLFGYFSGEKLDILIFGHTHLPFNKKVSGILCFNPGSPVKPAASFKPSVGILTIADDKKVTAEIIELV
ncbi:MAG: metallophosphoesterase family protein [Elusimicrobiota bacterium]